MRYVAQNNYKRLSHSQDTTLWKCIKGDVLDIERITNSNLIKITNRTNYQDTLFNEMFLNIEEYEEWSNSYLEHKV